MFVFVRWFTTESCCAAEPLVRVVSSYASAELSARLRRRRLTTTVDIPRVAAESLSVLHC